MGSLFGSDGLVSVLRALDRNQFTTSKTAQLTDNWSEYENQQKFSNDPPEAPMKAEAVLEVKLRTESSIKVREGL